MHQPTSSSDPFHLTLSPVRIQASGRARVRYAYEVKGGSDVVVVSRAILEVVHRALYRHSDGATVITSTETVIPLI